MPRFAFAAAGINDTLTYRGFKVDLSGFGSQAETLEAVKAVKVQIDMVERVGLSGSLLGFFKTFPVRIGRDLRGFHGTYQQGNISLAPEQLDAHSPTLLHEYMHAMHDRRIAGGFANAEILAAYKDAFWVKHYDGTNAAYFLTNAREFFAVTATLYLYGATPRNRPFVRTAIRDTQPDYYRLLGKLFGAR